MICSLGLKKQQKEKKNHDSWTIKIGREIFKGMGRFEKWTGKGIFDLSAQNSEEHPLSQEYGHLNH